MSISNSNRCGLTARICVDARPAGSVKSSAARSSMAAVSVGHACRAPQPITSRIWGSSVSSTSGRVAGSFICSRGRDEAVLVAGEQGGAEPELLRRGDVPGQARPDVQHLAGSMPFVPRPPATAARNSVSDGFLAFFSAERTRKVGGNRRVQVEPRILLPQAPLQLARR